MSNTNNKYICVRIDDKDYIFQFPHIMDHDKFYNMLLNHGRYNSWMSFLSDTTPELISAGFVDQDGECFGGSLTLNVKARANDTIILRSQTEKGYW